VPWIDSPFFDEELATRATSDVERQVATDYRRDGYVLIPNALPADLIDRAATELDRIFENEQTQRDRRFTDAWEFNGPAREIATGANVVGMLRYLYGREPIPFQTLSFQRGTEQRGHADAIHFDSLPRRFMCAVWVALEDIGPECGPLFYYPGSHALPEVDPYSIGQTVDDFDYSSYEDYQEALMQAAGIEARPFYAKKGDALLWSSNVVHGGSAILDPASTRRSQVTHYFFERCVYFTPMASDLAAGELYVRTYMVDINSGRRAQHSYDGRRVAVGPLRNGRSRLYIEPTAADRLAAGAHEVLAGFPKTLHLAKGMVRRQLRRRHLLTRA
jgi:ectoine hydroxylase-related dioxygenase (phytanoyl-CoA dioxygenase family)